MTASLGSCSKTRIGWVFSPGSRPLSLSRLASHGPARPTVTSENEERKQFILTYIHIAWDSPVIIALLCVSAALFVFFGIWERRFALEPVIPRNIFVNRSSVLILVSGFFYGGTFQSLMTRVPFYLSVLRRETTMASNLELLCLVLFACIANVSVGLIIVKTGHYRWAIRLALATLVTASSLLVLLKMDSTRGLIVGLMIVTGVASGGMINSEIVTAQASVAIEQLSR